MEEKKDYQDAYIIKPFIWQTGSLSWRIRWTICSSN